MRVLWRCRRLGRLPALYVVGYVLRVWCAAHVRVRRALRAFGVPGTSCRSGYGCLLEMTPRELRRLPEAEVIQHWAELYVGTSKLGAAQYIGLDALWVEVEIPHDMYEADWNGDVNAVASSKLALAGEYARRPGRLPPGMASFQGRDVKTVCVIDGNHRAHAAFLRGDPCARFYMPACDWDLFQTVIAGSAPSLPRPPG